MNMIELLSAKRTKTNFTGGYNQDGVELLAQPVTIGKHLDEIEDMWSVYTIKGGRHVVCGDDLSPHPLAPRDNVEFITMMMEYSSNALIHPFILIAIEHYAVAVLKATKEELGGDNAMVNPDAWRSMAHEALGWFVAREAADKLRRETQAPTG